MNVCMIAYTFYESDARVRRYGETLVRQGYHVDVIALRVEQQSRFEILNGVNVYRIQKRSLFEKKGRIHYFCRLLKFLIKSSLFFTYKHLQHTYKVIHIHSIPDFEVFAVWIAKLTESKIFLDIHDIVPEFYVSKFNVSKKSLIFKLLCFVEKISIKFSDHVIISNHLWEKTLINRSVDKNKITVILNYPDTHIFYRKPKTRENNKFMILYPGTINKHQGIDIAIKALYIIRDKIPSAEFHIYGNGPEMQSIKMLIRELELINRVFIKEAVPVTQITEIMANTDLGIVPKRDGLFGGEAFSTKILEFMAVGVPLIVADTKIDRYYFNENLVLFFRSGDEEDLARKIITLYEDRKLQDRLVLNALNYVKMNNWNMKEGIYLKLFDNLPNK